MVVKILIVNRRLTKIKWWIWKLACLGHFLLISFQVLQSLLKDEYFLNFTNFVYGFHDLLQKRISVTDVPKIEKLFKKFVIDMEDLFEVQTIGMNIHLLLICQSGAWLRWSIGPIYFYPGMVQWTIFASFRWFSGYCLTDDTKLSPQRCSTLDEVVGILKSDSKWLKFLQQHQIF